MVDPLAEVVSLLEPSAAGSKVVRAAGPWRVHRAEPGRPFYCVVLAGAARLTVSGTPLLLAAGDFVLVPSAFDFTMTSPVPPPGHADTELRVLPGGEVHHGDADAPPDAHLLVGYCTFGSPDAALLVPLLPQLVHVRGEPRLATLVELVREESGRSRPARDVVLARLLEVLLIEALRASSGSGAAPGLARGLADERIAEALRRIHEQPATPWTVEELAAAAALSRSAFFDRFRRTVGTAPMEYLLHWRMALAKQLLRGGRLTVGEVAQRVGYRSGSTFSVAFARHVGVPPSRYARADVRT